MAMVLRPRKRRWTTSFVEDASVCSKEDRGRRRFNPQYNDTTNTFVNIFLMMPAFAEKRREREV